MSADTPSAETPVQRAGTFTRLRLRFRAWRGNRPFWAGVFTLLGGVPIAYFPYATLKLGDMSIAMATTGGAGSLIIGVLLFTLGLTMWFQQQTRIFAGVASILLALVSLVVSNIGGFIVGFLFALIGGALSVSWMPARPQSPAEAEAPGATPFPAGDGGTPDDIAPDYGTDRAADDALPPYRPTGGDRTDGGQTDGGQADAGQPDGGRAEEPKGVHHVG